MADDVAHQLADQRVDLVVGHSMGALVALTLAASRPELATRLLIEDPLALGRQLSPDDVADSIERDVARADREPLALAAELLDRNPLWARADAANDVANLRSLDPSAVTGWLRSERWDLVRLVRDCPAPVHLLLALADESATTEPARSELVRLLGPQRVTAVTSSHSVRRDRPGIWVATVLSQLGPGPAE